MVAELRKRVVVIASGQTERRALPHLLSHLRAEGICICASDVLIPPGHRDLRVEIVEKIINSEWYGSQTPPDKFVILVDVDRKDPDGKLAHFKEGLPGRLPSDVGPLLQYAYARQHLEAWYFADAQNLREYLSGKDLGSVDASHPDEIENPKRHLKNLLGPRSYTALVSGEIAQALDARTIEGRSPSFRGFVAAVRDGAGWESQI